MIAVIVMSWAANGHAALDGMPDGSTPLGPAESAALRLLAAGDAREEDEEAPTPALAEAAAIRETLFDGTDTCAACHVTLAEPRLHDVVGEVARSVHSAVRVGCAACHGGDAHDPTARAHDPRTNFHARPRKTEILAICGGCHSSEALWKQLGLTTHSDPRKLFASSRHGTVLGMGDERAPTCTTCHGTHAIVRAKDPSSTVHATRVAALCGQCHSGRGGVGNSRAVGDPMAEWSRSAHAKALTAGNLESPSCSGCHGAHTTMCPPRSGGGSACARCHENEFEQFEKSPHKRPFARLGTDDCTGCHDHHDVLPATTALVGVGPESTCVRCHAWADKPRAAATGLAELLEQAHGVVVRTQTTLQALEARGVPPSEIGPLAAELHGSEQQVRLATHRLATELTAGRLADLVSVGARIESRSRELSSRSTAGQRGFWAAMMLVAATIAVAGATLARSKARASRRERGRR